MTERTTVRLPDELLMRAKAKAAAEGRTLTALIEDGLRHVVGASRSKAEPKRIMPRFSKARGGPLQGFEENPARAAQELDHLEYAERLKHLR